MKKCIATFGFAALAVSLAPAMTVIEVGFEGLGPVGFAPIAGVFHDGSFDVFDAGSSASGPLETLAEVGSPADLLANAPSSAQAMTITSGPGGAGTSGSNTFTVADGNSLFHFAGMVLPSNDWFIGNDTAADVSSLLGAAVGTSLQIDVLGVWDAGTESEDFMTSAGNGLFGIPMGNAPDGDVQGGVVSAVTMSDPFSTFANQPAGFDSTSLDFTGGQVARLTLTVVPEPSTALLGAFGLLGFLRRRRSA